MSREEALKRFDEYDEEDGSQNSPSSPFSTSSSIRSPSPIQQLSEQQSSSLSLYQTSTTTTNNFLSVDDLGTLQKVDDKDVLGTLNEMRGQPRLRHDGYITSDQRTSKKVVCGFPGCGKTFSSIEVMFDHSRVHKDRMRLGVSNPELDQYLAPFWPQIVPWKENENFMAKALMEDCFNCNFPKCKMSFNKKEKLDRHVRLAHSIPPPSIDNKFCKPIGSYVLVPPFEPPRDAPPAICHSHDRIVRLCPFCQDQKLKSETGEQPKQPIRYYTKMMVKNLDHDGKKGEVLLSIESVDTAIWLPDIHPMSEKIQSTLFDGIIFPPPSLLQGDDASNRSNLSTPLVPQITKTVKGRKYRLARLCALCEGKEKRRWVAGQFYFTPEEKRTMKEMITSSSSSRRSTPGSRSLSRRSSFNASRGNVLSSTNDHPKEVSIDDSLSFYMLLKKAIGWEYVLRCDKEEFISRGKVGAVPNAQCVYFCPWTDLGAPPKYAGIGSEILEQRLKEIATESSSKEEEKEEENDY